MGVCVLDLGEETANTRVLPNVDKCGLPWSSSLESVNVSVLALDPLLTFRTKKTGRRKKFTGNMRLRFVGLAGRFLLGEVSFDGDRTSFGTLLDRPPVNLVLGNRKTRLLDGDKSLLEVCGLKLRICRGGSHS